MVCVVRSVQRGFPLSAAFVVQAMISLRVKFVATVSMQIRSLFAIKTEHLRLY